MTEELNFKAICSLTTRVMGLPEGSLSLKSRKRRLQASRSVAAYIGLTEEDIKRSVIARVLKRDRTATYHYENKHKKNFKDCIVYRSCFEKIYKAYKDIEGDKNIFSDKDLLKEHLLQNGVRETEKSDVYLEVKSGQVKCKIKTTYFDFSNQLENVKIAMNKYHYTVNIL
tara:strand:- start:10543 stop:11052 length:510 start_codon:yes stop_codon:yes gene_type:complete